MSTRRPSRVRPALAVLAALAACSPTPAPTPGSDTPTPTVASTPAPAPSPAATTASPAPTSTPTDTAVGPTAPPEASGPPPTTAGALTSADVAVPPGWKPTNRPVDDGLGSNGTWLRATSAEHSAYAAIALGCSEVGPYPEPTAALEGTLTDAAGHPGVGLTLEFASADDAAGFFAEWVQQAEACVGLATEKVSLTGDTWVGHRTLETVWSEAVGHRGSTVKLVIVDTPDADLSAVFG